MLTDDAPIRGEVRTRGFRRVAHGLFLRERDGLPDDEFMRDLRAWLLVLPEGAVFTHVTAARLLGWSLPQLPEQVPVFAAVHGEQRRPRRPGLLCSRLVTGPPGPRPPPAISGLPVDAPEEILLRAARDLGHLDLVVMLDSAVRMRHVHPERMRGLLASRRPGVRALSAAYGASDARAESAGETLLRRFHQVMGVNVEPQAEIRDEGGRVVARADLLLVGTRCLHEYDGSGHRGAVQHRTDLRRERRLAGTSYVRRGYTLDDLVNHPSAVMHELDRLLERSHQQQRLRRWRRLIDHSMYSSSGRARLMNRWRREMGVVDWA